MIRKQHAPDRVGFADQRNDEPRTEQRNVLFLPSPTIVRVAFAAFAVEVRGPTMARDHGESKSKQVGSAAGSSVAAQPVPLVSRRV